MRTQLDFSSVKQPVNMLILLDHYDITKRLARDGPNQLCGPCPIHGGPETDCFHASTNEHDAFQGNNEKNAFECHSCGAKGTVVDFVALMEKCTATEAFSKLENWFPHRFAESKRQWQALIATRRRRHPDRRM